jgi:glycine cleavage system H protein
VCSSDLNEGLEDNPELINDDPYEKGWIIKMEIQNPEELEELLNSESYKELIGA